MNNSPIRSSLSSQGLLLLRTLIATTATPIPTTNLLAQGGPLTPPASALSGGNPIPSLKSLEEIDPGTPLNPDDFGATGIVINTSGYYYLTGNVTTVPATEVAILVNAPNVTIDLRGFTISSPSGSGVNLADSAIYDSGASQRNLTVINGIIEGAWYAGVGANDTERVKCVDLKISARRYGIITGPHAHIQRCQIDGSSSGLPLDLGGIRVGSFSLIQDCIVAQCAGDGFRAETSSSAINCIAYSNGADTGDHGFEMGDYSLNQNCLAYGNTGVGIFCGEQSSVLDCVTIDNGSRGINPDSGTLVARCVAALNTGDGIDAADEQGCTIVDCIAYDNDSDGITVQHASTIRQCTAYSNGAGGFRAGRGATIADCTSYDNTDDGFAVDSYSVMRHNSAYSNGGEGYDLATGCSAMACIAAENGDNGFSGASGSMFQNCSSRDNGQTGVNNAADGFEIAVASTVLQCYANNNEGAGIRATSIRNRIEDNTCYTNDSGGIDLTSATNLVIGNYCPSNASFNIDSVGGDIGPFENASTGTNPNANFQ
ncbi:MAG: right-handed parallel beta-helix repeat-containing protein [Verrucomicrobiota bacterium]